MPIRILPTEVASQIAAGEVIERPASVVKELLENAIDAGASQVRIETREAGRRLIEVADDGAGIPAGELALAVERHATSKLRNSDDLFHITSLGFRGEALASIGSVARLTITSRAVGAQLGARLLVEGGHASPVEPAGAPVGTLARVENLFFNVPARLKFLKQDATERRQVDLLATRYALAYPSIRFAVIQEARPALQTSGNGNRREVLAALYGAETARQMLEVNQTGDDLTVSGFISPISLTRGDRREMIFFVNGRPVQDAALIAALLRAYHTLLMVGRYPQAALFLELPTEAVDVNVHPTKAEVRFRDPERIFSGVQHAIRRALLVHSPAPGLGETQRWASPAAPRSLEPTWESGRSAVWGAEAADKFPQRSASPSSDQGGGLSGTGADTRPDLTPPPLIQTGIGAGRVPLLRLVGQVASAFLVAEGPDGLYLIDQHAAHERILFERFMAPGEAKIASQSLLQPVTVDLTPASGRALAEQLPILERLGFQVEAFGLNTYLVRAIPTLIAGSDPAAALRALVENFEEDETPLQAEIEARLIARICKRSAIKAGKSLSADEQRALLHDLEACQSPRTCPHGRPTMIHLSVDLLERQFGRRGAR